jgi:hypothetical protein
MVDHLPELENETPTSGVSMMDITELPEQQSSVMLFLLREQNSSNGVTLERLNTHFDSFEHLSEIVNELVKQGWLAAQGEEPDVRYRVVLRRRTHIRSNSMSNVFAMLGD